MLSPLYPPMSHVVIARCCHNGRSSDDYPIVARTLWKRRLAIGNLMGRVLQQDLFGEGGCRRLNGTSKGRTSISIACVAFARHTHPTSRWRYGDASSQDDLRSQPERCRHAMARIAFGTPQSLAQRRQGVRAPPPLTKAALAKRAQVHHHIPRRKWARHGPFPMPSHRKPLGIKRRHMVCPPPPRTSLTAHGESGRRQPGHHAPPTIGQHT